MSRILQRKTPVYCLKFVFFVPYTNPHLCTFISRHYNLYFIGAKRARDRSKGLAHAFKKVTDGWIPNTNIFIVPFLDRVRFLWQTDRVRSDRVQTSFDAWC